MPFVKLEDAIKKNNLEFFRAKFDEHLIQDFHKSLEIYIATTQKAIDVSESEEHLKNIMNKFLITNFYFDNRYSINTYKRVDSAIFDNHKLVALFEVKKPSNIVEMVSFTDINKKALHELIYYYLLGTRDVSGTKVRRFNDAEIRRFVITDTLNWFLFDTNDIEKICDGYLETHFYKYANRQLIYSNDADKFYVDIKEYLNSIKIIEKLPFIYFNLREYRAVKNCTLLYKALSPSFLLKYGYKSATNAQALNDKFYQELLYLMGLYEVKSKNNVTIEIDFTVKNSLADQVYNILRNDNEYDDITAIEKTFELVIIWMNRLLFIKLFEGRLISFNGNHSEYHILDEEKIKYFQDLQDLFFEVLGKKVRKDTDFLHQFDSVPYLNSSLFERYEIERREININELYNYPVKIKKNTITLIKDKTELPLVPC